MRKSIISVMLYLLLNPVASAAIITFDLPAVAGGVKRVDNIIERGGFFSGAFNRVGRVDNIIERGAFFSGVFNRIGKRPTGTPAISQYGGFSSLNFGLPDGSLMDLVSIDLAELSPGPVSVTFIAQPPGSVLVSQTFTTDGIFGIGNDFETFFFNDTFSGVDYVYIANSINPKNYNFAFDNIVIKPVPVPVALWLFVSGLVGFFLCFRPKK